MPIDDLKYLGSVSEASNGLGLYFFKLPADTELKRALDDTAVLSLDADGNEEADFDLDIAEIPLLTALVGNSEDEGLRLSVEDQPRIFSVGKLFVCCGIPCCKLP